MCSVHLPGQNSELNCCICSHLGFSRPPHPRSSYCSASQGARMSSEDEDRWFCPPRGWKKPACVQSMPELPSLESFQLLSLGYVQWVMPACGVHRSPGCALTVIGVAIADACVQMASLFSLTLESSTEGPRRQQVQGPGKQRGLGVLVAQETACF